MLISTQIDYEYHSHLHLRNLIKGPQTERFGSLRNHGCVVYNVLPYSFHRYGTAAKWNQGSLHLLRTAPTKFSASLSTRLPEIETPI